MACITAIGGVHAAMATLRMPRARPLHRCLSTLRCVSIESMCEVVRLRGEAYFDGRLVAHAGPTSAVLEPVGTSPELATARFLHTAGNASSNISAVG